MVVNFMTGGLKGYSFGILIETSYVPPSYGVPDGPLNEPLRFVRLSPTVSAEICEAESARISARSLAIRLALCPAIANENADESESIGRESEGCLSRTAVGGSWQVYNHASRPASRNLRLRFSRKIEWILLNSRGGRVERKRGFAGTESIQVE